MTQKDYVQYLTEDDRIHVSFTKERGKILRFSVNYSTIVGQRWHHIFRIDNCHGTPHLHRFYVQRQPFRIELGSENNQAFTDAKEYIVSSFQEIKANYLQVRPKQKRS